MPQPKLSDKIMVRIIIAVKVLVILFCCLSYSGKVWQVEGLVNLVNRLRFAKLKPSKVVVTINNPLADLFIRQPFFRQRFEKSKFAECYCIVITCQCHGLVYEYTINMYVGRDNKQSNIMDVEEQVDFVLYRTNIYVNKVDPNQYYTPKYLTLIVTIVNYNFAGIAEIITVFADVIIQEGNTTTITCEAFGYPPPTVVWNRINGILSDRVSVSDSVSVPTGYGNVTSVSVNLTITNASRGDTGVYTCSANNSIGSDSSNVSITVQCK